MNSTAQVRRSPGGSHEPLPQNRPRPYCTHICIYFTLSKLQLQTQLFLLHSTPLEKGLFSPIARNADSLAALWWARLSRGAKPLKTRKEVEVGPDIGIKVARRRWIFKFVHRQQPAVISGGDNNEARQVAQHLITGRYFWSECARIELITWNSRRRRRIEIQPVSNLYFQGSLCVGHACCTTLLSL